MLIAVPKLFGVEFRAVLTGSMTPEITVGSLVVIVPAKAEEIKVGDDITFVTKGDKVVTHRVVKIDREKDEYTTWGIANDRTATDAPSKYENILGVVRFHLPVVGRVFSWLATTYGKVITATAIVAVYLLSCILGIWAKGKNTEDMAEAPAGSSIKKNEQMSELMTSFAKSEELFNETQRAAETKTEMPVETAALEDSLKDSGDSKLEDFLDLRNPAAEKVTGVDPFEAFLKGNKNIKERNTEDYEIIK